MPLRRTCIVRSNSSIVLVCRPPQFLLDCIELFVSGTEVHEAAIDRIAEVKISLQPCFAFLRAAVGLTAEEASVRGELKYRLFSPLVLLLPYANDSVTLDTDACSVQVAFVCLQKQRDRQTKSVSYWSRFLIKSEQV